MGWGVWIKTCEAGLLFSQGWGLELYRDGHTCVNVPEVLRTSGIVLEKVYWLPPLCISIK